MAATFTPTPAESALVAQIFTKADPQKFGVLTGDVAVPIFSGSTLPSSVLSEIWSIADAENQGFLTGKGVSIALRLIGWAQKGKNVSLDLINTAGPLAVIDGYSSQSVPRNASSPAPRSPVATGLPPLTPQDKAKFNRLFHGCGPVNGLLSGDKARDVFVKSKLPVDKLSLIWNLSDTQNRGSLDSTDFTIAMYIIQALMSNSLTFVPTSLPPGLYEQASDSVASHSTGGVISHATGGSSGQRSAGISGGFPSRPSGIQPQYTGQSLQPQTTGSALRHPPIVPPRSQTTHIPAFPNAAPATIPQWDVTPAEKANSDKFFDTLDTEKRNFIEGDVAVRFLLQSNLPEDVLAQVWDLADVNNDGKLTREGFAIAMHLIQGKISGKEIPSVLPPTLVPPSLRTSPIVSSPFQQQQQPQQPSQTSATDALRDLLWDDPPDATPAPALQPQQTGPFGAGSAVQSQQVAPIGSPPLQPQQTGTFRSPPVQPQRTGPLPPSSSAFSSGLNGFPPPQQSTSPGPSQDPFGAPAHKDLLGDDDDHANQSPPIHDHSAETGNIQNQLSSTNRSLDITKNERSDVEARVSEQASQLASLQTQLSSAKAAYETETRILSALRERFSNQSAEIQKTRQELIHAESDLSATRVEKAEIEQHVLRDKEEVRDLQRKMTETGSTIEQMKVEIEKAKKNAKQQKGLLAIAKKQLATREAEKVKIEKELEDANLGVQAVTKEREEAEAEIEKEAPSTLADGHQRAASPSTDSVMFAASHPLPGTPGSPSSVASPGRQSTNPFDRLVATHPTGGSARSQSPFLPFSNATVPTPPIAATSAPEPNGATLADDPFGFEQALQSEAPKVAPATADSTPDTVTVDTDTSVLPPGPSLVGVISPVEVSSPMSDTDLFSTPPNRPAELAPSVDTTTSDADLAAALFPPVDSVAVTPAPAVDEHGVDTDLGSRLQELDIDESDSSDDEEDNAPLATLVPKPAEKAAEEAPVAASVPVQGTPPSISFDDAFGQTDPVAPFTAPPPTQGSSSAFSSSSPFDTAPTTTTEEAGKNAFDEAMGNMPGSGPTAEPTFTFDSAFDDNFDFGTAATTTATSPFPVGTNPSSLTSATTNASPFPPAPSTNGNARVSTFIPHANGFDSAFTPNGATHPATTSPTAQPPGLTQQETPFSFDDVFGGSAPAAAPAPFAQASQPAPPAQESHGISFDDAFGGVGPSQALALGGSAFGSTSSRSSAAPVAQVDSAPFPTSPPRGPTSPVRSSFSPPPREATTPPPRVSSPRLRSSTGSSRDSHHEGGLKPEKTKEPRHSKLSIRLPFGKKKKTIDVPPPSQQAHHLEPVPDLPLSEGATTPAVDDDIEVVKQLCGMGFSRTQAVNALETNGYDFQRALNSLLGA
ncbi:hypothetical protein OF83DRAFT_577050 [Amylostereum chailletii]|nr:hypothetical protein OF83DRAFT_577050 [Amylostereum chailletii]